MRIGVNNTSSCYGQIKELREKQVGDSAERGAFGTTNLQFEFHLPPYQKSRGADPFNAPECIPGSTSCLQIKGRCSGEQPRLWSQPTPCMSASYQLCDFGQVI